MLKIGDQVRSRVDSGRIGMVKALSQIHAGIQYYVVFWGGVVGSTTVAEVDLLPHLATGTPSEALIAGVVLGYAEFQRSITFHRLSREFPLRNNIYAFNASRTKFFPFQFKPLIKLLDSGSGRLLICDEVGLGKTIEAGLILSEERARRDIKTALVICPAGLQSKWKLELSHRFDERFAVLDTKAFLSFLDDWERAPDRVELNGIVSLHTLRGPAIRQRLEEVQLALDIALVDEAHNVRNFGTDWRAAVQSAIRDAGTAILLTATPVHLGTRDLFSLLHLLAPDEFPDELTAEERFRQNSPIVAAQRLVTGRVEAAAEALRYVEKAGTVPWVRQAPAFPLAMAALTALTTTKDEPSRRALVIRSQQALADLNLLGHILTRTRKRDVTSDVAQREAQAVMVTLTSLEGEFYQAISRMVYEELRRRTESPLAASWALNTIQRRMASSIHASVEYYRDGATADTADLDEDDLAPGLPLEGVRTGDAHWKAEVNQLVASWPDDAPDSKFECFARVLSETHSNRPEAKVLVFAFFKQTLRYLSRRLTGLGIEHVRIDGDVPLEEREARILRFKERSSCLVMLSSRVGSEGLDFQFADTLVNYDLPWNPMEVEQRIGRLDRIGQQSAKIHIINLWTIGTIEERILKRLYERIGIFEHSVGSLDPVLGAIVADLEGLLLDASLTPQEQIAKAEQIALVIEAERQTLEQLEQQAGSFMGVDAFFDEEIAGIQRARRYVTGEQLLRFLEDYLRLRAPGTRLAYDRHNDRGVIHPDAALQGLIQSHPNAGDLLHWLGHGAPAMAFTVNAGVGYANPSIEFINVLHPLVEIMRQDYEEILREQVSAQHVCLRSRSLPAGLYLMFVYRLQVRGVRPLNYLEAVVLDDGLEECLGREDAEALLGEVVEAGEEPPGGIGLLDPEFAGKAPAIAETILLARLAAFRAEEERANDALVDRKVASIKSQKLRQIQSAQARLERELEGEARENILRMARGKIRKLEGELQRQLEELESHRRIGIDHHEVAAAILEVIQP